MDFATVSRRFPPMVGALMLLAIFLIPATARSAPGELVRVLASPNPEDFRSGFGAAIVPYRGNLIVGAALSDRDTNDAGLVYLIDIASGEVIREFHNPTVRMQEEFGSSIAAQGDLVLIGAPNAFSEQPDRQLNDEGKAYLFNGQTGELLLTLHNPAGTINNRFGEAVAFLGTSPVVGAPFNDVGHSRSGAAYVFDAASGELLLTLQKAKPQEDHFGRTMTSSGGRVLVGAPFDESSGSHQGAAYLFGAEGALDRSFFHPDPGLSVSFGAALAGIEENLLIADPRAHGQTSNAGAVFLLQGDSGKLLRAFRAPVPTENARFGSSVAAQGDEVLVGAANSAYLFKGTTGGLLTRLEIAGAGSDSEIGASVAFLGNLLAVGAPYYQGKGAVFLFQGNDGTLADPCRAEPGGSQPDCNGNGVADRCDIETGASRDDDLDGVPDECEGDCNLNGLADDADILAGLSADCDRDGRPDECTEDAADCNGNRLPDSCDVGRRFDFLAPYSYSVRQSLHQTIAQDLDGDGLPDLIAGGFADHDVAVLENRGSRIFTAPRFIPVGASGPQRVAARDFDGDGLADLATLNVFGRSVSLVPNSASFSFGPPAVRALAENPGEIVAADLDGDRGFDLAILDGAKSVSLLFNGAGDLVPVPASEQGASLVSLDSGDLDGDGDVELISAGTGGVTVLFNAGQGEFDRRQDYSTPETPNQARPGDLDGDGDLDLVLAYPNSFILHLLRNNGQATFGRQEIPAMPGEAMAIADLEGDGDLDIAMGTLLIFRNQGQGTFERDNFSQILPGPRVSLGATDLDRDGLADLFWPASRSVSVLWNTGRMESSMRALRFQGNKDPWMTAAADWNGDATIDLAVASSRQKMSIFDQRDGAFEERLLIFESGFFADPLILGGDLNDDGRPDLVNLYQSLEVLLNDGTGLFPSSVLLQTDRRTWSAELADLDGDGDLDVVSANPSSDIARGTVSVLSNDGAGTFLLKAQLEVQAEPMAIVAADLNGDGRNDLAALSREPLGVSIFHGQPDGGLVPGPGAGLEEIIVDGEPYRAGIQAADLDSDGDADLVLFVDPEPAIHLLFNGGNSEFGRRTVIGGNRSPVAMAVQDLDGDGSVDLLASELDQTVLRYLVNDGGGRFISRSSLAAGHTPAGVTAADMNGDGLVDLIVSDPVSKTVGIVQGGLLPARSLDSNGDGSPDECALTRPFFHRGDVNGDGTLDVSDGLCLLDSLFVTGAGLSCLESADANGDGQVDCSDGINILGYLFLGTSAPVDPGPPPAPCGPDPDPPGSALDLGCESYAHCAPAN